MTRETKIGLLVGLAFIIVIGILLSDHLTSSTEPPPAPLANAGHNVRQTVTTPGSNATPPPITTVHTPQQLAPNQPVPTPGELQPRPQPVQIVQIGGPTAPTQTQPQQQQQTQPVQTQAPLDSPIASAAGNTDQSQSNPNDAPIITQAPSSLAQVAQQHGEGLVTLDPNGRATASGSSNPSWTTSLTGAKEYKAEAGDSVSKMATKFFGSNTKTNREAIVKANPSLQQDPNKVIVGHTYMIPAGAGIADASPSGAGSSSAVQVVAAQPNVSTPAAAPASATEYWYTVKENDSLWKIANDQLGNPGSVAAIKELNKDALKGGETVFIGMKLKLPGKPLAKAN
jgi:nucleoid-associated protein YgaU